MRASILLLLPLGCYHSGSPTDSGSGAEGEAGVPGDPSCPELRAQARGLVADVAECEADTDCSILYWFDLVGESCLSELQCFAGISASADREALRNAAEDVRSMEQTCNSCESNDCPVPSSVACVDSTCRLVF